MTVALLLAAAFVTAGCSRQDAPAASATPTATLKIGVSGMTCDSCVTVIEGTLARMPGVQECTVSLEEEVATVVVDGTVTSDLVIEAIEGIGNGQYQARTTGP